MTIQDQIIIALISFIGAFAGALLSPLIAGWFTVYKAGEEEKAQKRLFEHEFTIEREKEYIKYLRERNKILDKYFSYINTHILRLIKINENYEKLKTIAVKNNVTNTDQFKLWLRGEGIGNNIITVL